MGRKRDGVAEGKKLHPGRKYVGQRMVSDESETQNGGPGNEDCSPHFVSGQKGSKGSRGKKLLRTPR